MALIKCPDCGKEVSGSAPACPNCGRPLTRIIGKHFVQDDDVKGNAVTHCAFCGKRVSDEDEDCPACGKSMASSRSLRGPLVRILGFLATMLVLVLLFRCGGK